MNKLTSIKEIGRILTLVGSIMDSIFGGIITIVSMGLGSIVVGPIIVLSWTARDKALKGSQGWLIYGIVYGALFNWISAAGYIVLLVSKLISNLQDEGWTITISKSEN